MNMYELLFENKIKGADGKACWDGYRYAGTEDGKDKCVPVKEDEYDDDEEQQDQGFFIVLGSEDEGGFVGMVTKDGGKWRESVVHGNAPYNWGSTYMGYLTSGDVMQHMRNDYQRHYAVKGPFTDEQEAIEYAEYQFGQGDNDFEEGVEEAMDISMEPDNESRDAVKSAICNRITRMHVPLLSKYGLDAVLQAIDDVADWVGDVDEIGSSDVSAWTKDVIQTLERQGG